MDTVKRLQDRVDDGLYRGALDEIHGALAEVDQIPAAAVSFTQLRCRGPSWCRT
jgi:hypothetical protein